MVPIAVSTYLRVERAENKPIKAPGPRATGRGAASQERGVGDERWEGRGVRKLWRQQRRESRPAVRCTVSWVTPGMGLRVAVRGRHRRRTVDGTLG